MLILKSLVIVTALAVSFNTIATTAEAKGTSTSTSTATKSGTKGGPAGGTTGITVGPSGSGW